MQFLLCYIGLILLAGGIYITIGMKNRGTKRINEQRALSDAVFRELRTRAQFESECG